MRFCEPILMGLEEIAFALYLFHAVIERKEVMKLK